MYICTTTHTPNYSQQELSDRFTLQPGGTNIHALKLPSAVSSGIRLTTTALKHRHTHTNTHILTHSTTPLHLIHPELLTPAEVGQWVYSSLAGLQRRWHTPWLRPGPAPLSSSSKYFPSQAPHVLRRPKKTGMYSSGGGTRVRKETERRQIQH